MAVVIIDGPECAGKSTIIDALTRLSPKTTRLREWGPVSSWHEYVVPFSQDRARSEELTIWSRSWASEVVYNNLLQRGRSIQEREIRRILENPEARREVVYVIVCTDPELLEERRVIRREQRGKPDLPVDPWEEMLAFADYAKAHRWRTVSGQTDPEQVARGIMKWIGALKND